tara:strand:- start:4939 stop:5142 length:204 start_codon:yes stop_codon:yes gene_type:complete
MKVTSKVSLETRLALLRNPNTTEELRELVQTVFDIISTIQCEGYNYKWEQELHYYDNKLVKALKEIN